MDRRGSKKGWLAEAAAAATLLAIAVPEQLATSRLAGMPPISGLYAFVCGTVLFALIGSNPRMSVGADSTIAPLFAVGIGHLAPIGTGAYAALVGILAVVVGVLVALVGFLRLGWIAELLSAPIVTGFMAGVSVIIVVHQLPDLLGLAPRSGSTLGRLAYIFTNLARLNGWTLGIGVVVLVVVAVADHADQRLPGALVGLVLSTVLVATAGLASRGVAVLGAFSHGLPHLGLGGLGCSALRNVLPVAGVVGLVVISQSAATTQSFPGQAGYDLDVNRDFLGIGAGNVLAGLVGAFPVNASPPRTAAVTAVGGRTRAVGLGAAAGVVLLIPAAGVLRDVPVVTLAAVLLFVAGKLFHVGDLRSIARFDGFELGLAALTLVIVAFVGVEQGIACALGLAILDRTRLSARPQLHVLGRIRDTTSWAPLSSPEPTSQVPGVLVVLFATPLWYANAAHFRAEMKQAWERSLGTPEVVVLDAVGMTDIDFTGARALSAVLDDLDSRTARLAVARAGQGVRRALERFGLDQRLPAERFFGSVDEAVVGMPRSGG